MNKKIHNLYKLPYDVKVLSERDFLDKYCYSNTSDSIRASLKETFKNSKDEKFIAFCYDFMIYAIMPYYYANRTLFNRVRGDFMDAVYYIRLQSTSDTLYKNLKNVYNMYSEWCICSGITNDDNCSEIYDFIMSKSSRKSEINSDELLEGII